MATIKQGGIYAIWNSVSGKVYVGSSVCLMTRQRRHFDDLKNAKHPNSHLQRAYLKHGQASFVFTVIETCKPEKLIEREQFWMDEFRITHTLYNASPTAGNQLGIKRSDETKRKMSEAQKARKYSPSEETRQKMAQAKIGTANKKGAKLSAESCERIGAAKRGLKASEQTKQRLSLAKQGNKNAKGFKQSLETIQKRVAASAKTRAMNKVAS